MATKKRSQQARRAASAGERRQRRGAAQRVRRAAASAATRQRRETNAEPWRQRLEVLADHRWQIVVSAVFVVLGILYFARWAPIVEHRPSVWTSAEDLMTSYRATVAFTHGHFSAVYARGFIEFPGTLLLLTPIAAFNGTFSTAIVKITNIHGHLVSSPTHKSGSGLPFTNSTSRIGPHQYYIPHPQALIFLLPYVLVLSCIALFAADTLAKRLEVAVGRRAVLTAVEAVLLWNVTVFWGHPEDTVALALALWSFLFALDRRWGAAGWLFGASVAVQPLVIVILPILLFIGGKGQVLGLVLRGALPTAAIALPMLVAAFHTTVHALVDPPAFPNLNHATPWVTVAPKLGGSGLHAAVAGGPGRAVALLAACLVGVGARRWRLRPDLLAWALAGTLLLRCYTAPSLTAYYMWPALAMAVVVGARRSAGWFWASAVLAGFVTVAAQWHLSEYPWWLINALGTTVVLVLAGGDMAPWRRPRLAEVRATA